MSVLILAFGFPRQFLRFCVCVSRGFGEPKVDGRDGMPAFSAVSEGIPSRALLVLGVTHQDKEGVGRGIGQPLQPMGYGWGIGGLRIIP